MARQANVCIGVAPDVKGGASIVINKKSFIDVVKDICEMCRLRYSIQGNFLKIENDTPFLKTYNVRFLNTTREISEEIVTANDTMSSLNSSSESKGTGGKDNGSSSSVKGGGKTDFWAELEANLKMILHADGKSGDAVTVHRQAGIVTVMGTDRQHKFIDKYISSLKKAIECQVLIEVKILEVGLFDQYKGGIDWSSSSNSRLHLGMTPVSSLSNNDGITTLSVGYNGANFQSILRYIEKFGVVRTLSNPRITVMNNQSAVMKIAKNEIITRPSLYRQFSSTLDSRNSDAMSVDIQTIPIGIIFTVHPAIDIQKREITLTVRPTLSRVLEQREVEVYSYTTTGVATPQKISIPIVEVREMDSVLKLKSGQIVVMQEVSKYNRVGIPGTKNKQILRNLFNATEDNSILTELVVFLRARILDKNGKKHIVHKRDAECLKKCVNDPRPFVRSKP